MEGGVCYEQSHDAVHVTDRQDHWALIHDENINKERNIHALPETETDVIYYCPSIALWFTRGCPILLMDVSILADGIMSTSLACLMRSRANNARERVGFVPNDLFFSPNASNRERRVSSGK